MEKERREDLEDNISKEGAFCLAEGEKNMRSHEAHPGKTHVFCQSLLANIQIIIIYYIKIYIFI